MSSATTTLDPLETRPAAEREAALMAALPGFLARAREASRAVAQALEGVDPAAVNCRSTLARLPVTRKHELLERQAQARADRPGEDPFGGFSAIGWRGLAESRRRALRVLQSPGPIYEPQGDGHDFWRVGRALRAAGFASGDLVHNSFSYHLTPGGWMMDSGAQAIGCTVFPGGVGNTEQQLAAMRDLRPSAYVGTPSFLRILVEKSLEAGAERLSVQRAMVSGEACPPALTQWFAEHGLQVYQCYATADAGLIAYQTEAREGMVVDEGVILEIVRPGTGDVLPEGEVGEVVVTVLNDDYPLLRFGTGDLSAILPGPCPTGRSGTRIRGWLGRADQTTKVRGMFVHPGQIAEVLRRHPQVRRGRLLVEGEMANDRMTLECEAAGDASPALAEALGASLRDITKLRGDVRFVPMGQWPNDGKVIDDQRKLG